MIVYVRNYYSLEILLGIRVMIVYQSYQSMEYYFTDKFLISENSDINKK